MKYPISAVILTRNEEKNISRCLTSVSFCNEILIIDDCSTDKTSELAKKRGIKVLKREMKGNFAEQRNYALTQAMNKWVLFIDADEEVTIELLKSFINAIHTETYSAYYVKRRDFWWGKELKFGETRKVRNKGILRLMRKESGEWMGNVHEVFHTSTDVGTLNGYLNHFPHQTVKEFLTDINVYSTLRAKELYGLGKSADIFSMIFYPFFKFNLNYFVYLGFFDGPAGFAYAFFMSFHSFLVRAKLYQFSNLK